MSSRSSAKPAVIPGTEYESEVTIVTSEKRLVRASGQVLRSPNTGLTGPRRAVHYLALHSRTELFFSGRSWDYINILSPHNAQFLSTYRSVRLHNSFTCMGNRIGYFSSGSSMETHRFLYE